MPSSARVEEYLPDKARERLLKRTSEAYDEFKRTRVLSFPEWLYGPVRGKRLRVEVEDFPRFGEEAWLEFDSGRTAFLEIDMQTDFCGRRGYVDVMGYDLSLTSAPIVPIKRCLDAVRGTEIKVVHTREGHMQDLCDCPFNKVLRSKLIGKGVGIGDVPTGGLGRLLIRGEKNWDTIEELYPIPGEYVVDKAGKGAYSSSPLFLILRNLDVSHLVLTGITTDVCVHSVMREANDLGYWCLLLKDCTGTTDYDNHLAAIKQIKMSGGIFGWISDSERFIQAVRESKLKR